MHVSKKMRLGEEVYPERSFLPSLPRVLIIKVLEFLLQEWWVGKAEC